MPHQAMYFNPEAVPYEVVKLGLDSGGFETSRKGLYWLKRVGNVVELRMSKPDGRRVGLVQLTPHPVRTRKTLVGGDEVGCHILLTWAR